MEAVHTAPAAAWRDRVRGCLLGGALGDAVGAPFEGWPRVGEDAVAAVLASSGGLMWTDDTALQLALAAYLAGVTSGEIDDDAVALALAEAWRREPHRGYGANPPQIFRRVLAGEDWRAAAAASFGGAGSLGNGGAMRVAPVGTLPLEPADVAGIARRTAAVTHAHAVGQDGAVLVAVAVHHLLRSSPVAPVDPMDLLASCQAHVATAQLGAALAAVEATLDVEDPEEVAARTGNGIAAHEAAPAALSAFLHRSSDPVEAIAFAVRMGGDTDTVAAMAGSMAGAAVGARRLPPVLVDRVERRGDIEDVADALARRTARTEPRPGAGQEAGSP